MKHVKNTYDHIWKLAEERLLIRRIVLFWFLSLLCFATLQIFGKMDQVNASIATAYATLAGLNGAVFGFYSQSRKGDG